ncbi:MAG TPA: glycoside hydrolase family 9 protein, partial [Cyclobacteriaceae bacterium]|nr:glycoside hydrolase family 9 protein [Cyclobacteriaceae bacterium]
TKFAPETTVPFLNRGGWHDAGDNDLAAGSQAATTHYLVLAYELSGEKTDQTTIDFEGLNVFMHRPDGVPDFVQQIKHGAINLLSGYRASGHSFAGIIANLEGSYLSGDWVLQTDQLFFNPELSGNRKTTTHSGNMDDRWVFTNKDSGVEYKVAAALAAASRSLKGYDNQLAEECIGTAKKIWDYEQANEPVAKPNAYVPRNIKLEEIIATAELLYTTGEEKYSSHLVGLLPSIEKNFGGAAWCVSRVTDQMKAGEFNDRFMEMLRAYKTEIDSVLALNPFGVPWKTFTWGIGWNIQQFALEQYYLVTKYPDLFDREIVFRVVNYVLGCHPGSSTSFISGVGAHSVLSAFGMYRDMEYYIPGGNVSGTALIRPDFPELKENTPYLWQQSEYVMPGAATYIFCVLAANNLLGIN